MIKVAIISTVRAPIEELRMFVDYHLNIGIDNIILFFDDPFDEGADLFSQYQNVTTIKCSSDYWLEKKGKRPEFIPGRQVTNVNEGVKIALSKGCNWIIHIDRDELINPLEDLKQVLSSTKAEAVRFTIMEAVSNKERYEHIFQPTLFRKKQNKRREKRAKSLGCSNAFFDNEYFRGHTSSKLAVKISSDIKEYKIHKVEKYHGKLNVEKSEKIQLLHYDCVGIDDWMMKWNRRLDGRVTSISIGERRKKQLILYEKAKEKGNKDLSLLFKQLHTIPIREKVVLYLLGMIKTVKLNKHLFYDNKIK